MRSTLGLEGRNKVLLISDNAIFTENLVACLKGKGIEMLHTMYLKKVCLYSIYNIYIVYIYIYIIGIPNL